MRKLTYGEGLSLAQVTQLVSTGLESEHEDVELSAHALALYDVTSLIKLNANTQASGHPEGTVAGKFLDGYHRCWHNPRRMEPERSLKESWGFVLSPGH